ncbi:MAG: WG repeat-containing protein, partial [Ignavibacteriae bacterium]|nr:WG repeat-containing protein [Ignavibacteriota bacterium]
ELNDKWGFIDKEGNEVIPFKYNHIGSFYFVDLEILKQLIEEDYKEDNNDIFDKGLAKGIAKVELNDKWGFIDKEGNEVIPIKYDEIFNFKEGLARVKLNNKWGFINEQGREVIPAKYDEIDSDGSKEGLLQVKLNGKWEFVDREGTEYWED